MRCPHCQKEFEPQKDLFVVANDAAGNAIPYSGDFLALWEAYPRHPSRGHKYPAWKAWLKMMPPHNAVMIGLSRAKACKQWREGFAPHMSTWLNARGWEDDYSDGAPRGYQRGDLR